ncbi:MAG TPA: nicotinate-nucleotide adenylyltransferase [Candidatus Kapabacteria bacterium]|nr:nicotinate-nucleotide adenylyltransferase [Candidatus Kapabacteria bacterium]
MTSSPPALTGLYGGSFDPVHIGHVATAEELLVRLPFREIRLLPAARSPLKDRSLANHHRVAMLKLAVQGHAGLAVDDRELRRAPPSFTVDTLHEVRSELGRAAPLAFIMGLDSFLELPRWKDWQHLTDYAHLVVVSRPGSHPSFAPPLADWLEKHRITEPESLESRPFGGVLLVETTPHDVASRVIRAAVRAGQSTADWLAPAVRDYIDTHHLYAGDADPQ